MSLSCPNVRPDNTNAAPAAPSAARASRLVGSDPVFIDVVDMVPDLAPDRGRNSSDGFTRPINRSPRGEHGADEATAATNEMSL
jgi:hypothetical protein